MNKNRALFLDRDGIINIDKGYIGTIERFAFCPGLFPFLRAARDLGYRLAILTNQSGVARGFYSEADYNKVTAFMLDELQREAIEIDLVLASFEHPDSNVAAYSRESFWRKPNPGMVMEATRRMDIDPARSIFLGDNLRDMEAAQAGGVGKCLLLNGKNQNAPAGYRAISSYDEALKILPFDAFL